MLASLGTKTFCGNSLISEGESEVSYRSLPSFPPNPVKRGGVQVTWSFFRSISENVSTRLEVNCSSFVVVSLATPCLSLFILTVFC